MMFRLFPAFALAGTLVAVLSAGACARSGSPVGTLRFHDQAPVWLVDDQLDTPKKPKDQVYMPTLYEFHIYLWDPLLQALQLPEHERAHNVNALGEVPDSNWFRNRLGVRSLSVDDMRRGPDTDDGPEAHKPWTITSTKIGGASVGFWFKDTRGERYLLKFDERGFPEIETGAHMVTQRIIWALGYFVPEDRVVHFNREDLVLAEDATIRDEFGHKKPLSPKVFEQKLALIEARPGEPIRGMASKFLPGIPIGGYANEGVRKDDPNDVVPHEHRRDLRGLWVFSSWLNHTDIKMGNSLDVWLEDKHTGKHFVRHYLLDFGKALGAMGSIRPKQQIGFTYWIDLALMTRTFFTLGARRLPWEDLTISKVPAVGMFHSEYFYPPLWKPDDPYQPFLEMDRFDAFWATRIVMRFTPELIRAAVEQGRYSDPRTGETITRILIERQQKIGRYWFAQVNPLAEFTVQPRSRGYQLCFSDLLVAHGFAEPGVRTQYLGRGFGHSGAATGWQRAAYPDEHGVACLSGIVPQEDEHNGYTIVQIHTYRGQRVLDPVDVHMARDPDSDQLRLIGIHRH